MSTTKTKKDAVPNLFATAAVKQSKTAAKDDKDNFIVEEPAVIQALADYDKAKKDLDAATAKLAEAESVIKPHAKEKWLELYKKTGKRPESFILSNKTNNSLLFIVMDAYKKIDEDRYTYLKETYGDDIVTDNSEFQMDKDMIQKYGAQISEAIVKAKNIPDEDKGQIIKKIENYSIAKGTIEKLVDLAKKAKTTIANVFEEIWPTQQLKSRGKK